MPVGNFVEGSIGWLSSEAPLAKVICPKVGSGVSVGVGVSVDVGVTVIVGVGVTVGASAVMVAKNSPATKVAVASRSWVWNRLQARAGRLNNKHTNSNLVFIYVTLPFYYYWLTGLSKKSI